MIALPQKQLAAASSFSFQKGFSREMLIHDLLLIQKDKKKPMFSSLESTGHKPLLQKQQQHTTLQTNSINPKRGSKFFNQLSKPEPKT